MSDVTYRPATLDDAEAIAALLNERDEEFFGLTSSWTGDHIRGDLQGPGFDLSDSSRLAIAPDDTLAACEIVFSHINVMRANTFGLVGKAWRGHGIGTGLIEWAIERASANIPHAPDGAQVSVATTTCPNDADGLRLLTSLGFTYLRSQYTMRIDFDGTYAVTPLPDGFRLVTYSEQPVLLPFIETLTDSFRDHFGFVETPIDETIARWQHEIENGKGFDGEMWWLAYHGDEPAGVLMAGHTSPLGDGIAWIDDLGVRRQFRQQGLGSALLSHAFGVLQRRGHSGVGLGVDASSLTNAVALYERAGMRIYQRFDRYQKILRAGEDLGRH